MKIVAFGVLVMLLVALATAAPGSYFSKADSDAVKALIKAEAKGGDYGSPQANLAAAEASALLGAPLTATSAICDSALKALEGDSLQAIRDALEVRSLLKCAAAKTPDATIDKIEQGLTKTEDAVAQLAALGAAAALQAKGVDKSKIDEAATELVEHLSNDGFKIHEDLDNGSGYYTGLLLEALAALKNALSPEAKEAVMSGVADSVKGYLSSSAVQDESNLYYPHSDSSVNEYVSTSTLVDGVIKYNKAFSTKLFFHDDKVNKMANFFLSHTHLTSVEEAHAAVLGLYSLNSGTWRKPLVITASQTTLKAGEKGDDAVVRFQVSDIFGEVPSKLPKLFIVSLTSSESTAPLITNQELAATGNNFDFNFLATKPAPGNYKLVLSLTPSKTDAGTATHAAIKATTRYVKVISSIDLSELNVAVKKSKGSETSHTFVQGQKSDVKSLDVQEADTIELSFSVKSKGSQKSVTVQQAFVLLTQGEEHLYHVAKFDAAKKLYTVSIRVSTVLLKFTEGGKLNLKLLIGDSYIDNSIAWDVVSVNVKLSKEAQEKLEKQKSQTAATLPKVAEGVSSYKPVINHRFRPADKRADLYISRAFTLLTIAPIGIFILGALIVGLNFSLCPGGLGLIFALAFHVGIGAIAYIIYLFFLQNNLFETLQLLCYALPPTIFVGQRALKGVAQKRTAALAAQANPQ